LNRGGLEKAACECYGLINDEFARLLGTSPAQAARSRARA
jgi:hypothetical protein